MLSRLAGVVPLALAVSAGAELTEVFSTTALTVQSSVEIEGVRDEGARFTEFFRLNEILSMDETRSSSASIPGAIAVGTVSAFNTFSVSDRRIDLDFDADVSSTLTATGNDVFSRVQGRFAHITRFDTDLPVEVRLRGSASFGFSLFGGFQPVLDINVFRIIDVFAPDPPAFERLEAAGALDETITLPPGSYQLQVAIDSTQDAFGFPAGEYTVDSAFDFTATVTTIPAPGATALTALVSAGVRRRR